MVAGLESREREGEEIAVYRLRGGAVPDFGVCWRKGLAAWQEKQYIPMATLQID